VSFLKRRQASIFTKLIVLGLIVYGAISLISLHGQIEAARAGQETLTRQVENIAAQNEAYEYEIEHRDSHETIERIARNNYNLVMPGERTFRSVGER